MIRYIVLILALALTACEGSNNGVPSTGSTSGGGLVNSLASGFAAGAGAAAGHHAINGAINKWQERKAARSIAPTRQYSGFNRMSRGVNRR